MNKLPFLIGGSHMKLRYLAVLTLVASSCLTLIGGDLHPGSTEVSIGLGLTSPREQSPLNVAGESPMPNALVLNLGFRRYVGDMAAVGVRAFGTINKLSDYRVSTGDSSSRNTDFNITTYSIALEGLVYVTEGKRIRPYVLLVVAYSGGLLTNKDMGSLNYQGVTAGGGGGIRFSLSEKVALSLEALATFGSAKWKNLPFKNSGGNEYNPSTFIALAGVSFLTN